MRIPSTPEQEKAVGLKFLYRAGHSPVSPFVLFVHGRAGTREVMWTFERFLPSEVSILALEAPEADVVGGFSWWNINTVEDVTSAACAAAELVAQSTKTALALLGLTPERSIALGFSQGAAVLSCSVLGGHISVNGLGLLSGFVVEPDELRVTKATRFFIAHGTKDEVVRIERARSAVARLRALGNDVVYLEDDVGHKIGVSATRALSSWSASVLLPPTSSGRSA